MAHRQPRHPGGPLGVGAAGDHRRAQLAAVVDLLLEGERRADDAAVELGDRHAHRHVERRQAGLVVGPVVADRLHAGAWIDRHAQVGELRDLPVVALVVGRAPGAAHGQHGGDQHVDAVVAQQLERLDPTVGVGPQRVARHRAGVAAGDLDRPAQVGHELRVPGHPVGPVEHDADERAVGSPLGARSAEAGAVPHLGERQRAGRVEPEPAEQHRVGHEAQQVLDVGRPAGGQVAVGLAGGPGGHGRQPGQLGVGLGLAAEGDERTSAAAQPAQVVEGRLPGGPPAEQADDHGAHAVEVGGGVEADPGWPPARPGARRAGGGRSSRGRAARCRRC